MGTIAEATVAKAVKANAKVAAAGVEIETEMTQAGSGGEALL